MASPPYKLRYYFMCVVCILHRIASDVCGGIITKCLNASRAKTKEKGMEALMLIIEAEKADIVQVGFCSW